MCIVLFEIVFLNGERVRFYFDKDVLIYVLNYCPKLTFSFIKNLAVWLDCQFDSVPFCCETYDFYIVKE